MKKITKLITVLLSLALMVSLMPANLSFAKDEDSVFYQEVDSVNSLQNFIDSDGQFSSQDTITTAWSGTGGLHKISVDQDGWIFIRGYSSDNDYAKTILYSNFAMTNQIGKAYCSPDASKNLLACYVTAGNYYYVTSRWNGSKVPMINTCYVGFMPSEERIKVDTIKYSKDKTVATVTFDYDQEYLPSLLEGTLRVVKKNVAYTDLYNNDVWKTETRENALEKNSFKVTSNGTYTARIAGGGNDAYFAMCTFDIEGLKDGSPSTPKINSYKKGTKVISGTATKNTKITVKVSGKSYKATVNSKGKWKVSVKSKLKKGQKVTAVIKTSAGTKSKTKTVTVK